MPSSFLTAERGTEETSQPKASGISSKARRPFPDVKKTTLTDEVADDYLQLCNEGRFTKKYVPRGYITDLDWTTIHNNQDQPIKPVKQEEDPTEATVTPAAPTEVKGPPSRHLRSKTKQQSTTTKQEQPECNLASLDPPERNPGG